MDDLFDVFDPKPGAKAPEPQDAASSITAEQRKKEKKERKERREKNERNKKRKADGQIKAAQSNEEADTEMPDAAPASHDDDDESDGLSDGGDHKRRRKQKKNKEAVMADSFQTAESRQVVAAAGLTSTAEVPTEGEQPESLIISHNIQHQVALPPDLDYEYTPLSEHKPPEEPARTYPFKLDPFQQMSISSIQREESVLVSAHTSAGKTVVAEYAIAQCLKREQRIIYTSPIKALSNQKFRDFQGEFGDVGLMTGDVTINPTASCLVMTTEILRSMLYRGSEIMREVAWVIFDEIHYLRDAVRGVVWEETIILLPDNVKYVFLSATIPNAFQFAEWIVKIHRQPCHVVYTDFRPTPLQNFAHPTGAKGIWLIVDEKGNFKEKNFQLVMDKVGEKKALDMAGPKGKGPNRRHDAKGSPQNNDKYTDMQNIIKMIIGQKFNPVIVFNFSKKEIEDLAGSINRLNFNNPSESLMVEQVFKSAVDTLASEDQDLNQITMLLPLLKKGIGIHHAGLLPILKETIEILFQEGLIKVLFATETFSIGLNMPAKTVVFTSVEKFDGKKQRPLTPSEYIQMSGRAGRRGLDDRGLVIMMINEKMEADTARGIVHGRQDNLNSAFYLSYNMILNLLRIETVSPEYMLERCFYQFQNASGVPELERQLSEMQEERDDMAIPDEAAVKEYYSLRSQLTSFTKDMYSVIQHPDHCIDWLPPGRLVQIADPVTDVDYGWGIVIDLMNRKKQDRNDDQVFTPQESKIVVVGLPLRADSKDFSFDKNTKTVGAAIPPGLVPASAEMPDSDIEFGCVPCLLTCIKGISEVRVFVPPDIRSKEGSAAALGILREAQRRLSDGMPRIDPIKAMGIKDESFKKLMRKIEVLESRLFSSPMHQSDVLPRLYEQYSKKVALNDKIKGVKKAIEKAHTINQLDELKSRKRVLRRLGFIDEREVVQMKARVACEISSTGGHELLLAELILNRFFNDMSPEMTCAVLSVFVFEEKVKSPPNLQEKFDTPFKAIKKQAAGIAKVAKESKLEFSEEDYLNSFKPELMETVFAWASGAGFAEVCRMVDVFEGSLVRVMRRLEELLRQLGEAASVMGSKELAGKFEEGLGKIRRSVVSSQSLYL